MNKAFNIILVLCVLGLLYVTYASVMDDVNGEQEVQVRAREVQKSLLQIAVIEDEYKKQDANDRYCESMDDLIRFCKEGRLAYVVEEGILTADQMDGKVGGLALTDSIAAAIVARGNQAEIAKYGLQGFKRDTMWVNIVDSLRKHERFSETWNPEDIKFIPFSDGKVFDIQVFDDVTRSGLPICTMEARAEYETYMSGLGSYGDRQIRNLREAAEQQGKFAGLKIGGIGNDNWNNNAGNWEQ